MKQIFLVAIIALLDYAPAQAQEETLFGAEGLKLTGVWGATHPGLSRFMGEDVAVGGGYIALEFNRALLLGIGGSHTTERFDTDGGDFNFDANTLYIGYAINGHRVLHPKLSLMMGGAKLKSGKGEKDNLFVVIPGGGVEVNMFRWFKFGLNANYRFVSNVDYLGLDQTDLSGFFFEMQFRFGWSWGG